MKKFYFITILILTLNIVVLAQSQGTLIGGTVFSTAKSSDYQTHFVVGPFVGFQFYMNLDENYYLKIFPQFTQLGYGFEQDSLSAKVKLNYFRFPVRVHQKYQINNVNLFFEAGPYLSIGSNGKKIINGEEDEAVQFGPENDQYRPVDYGIGGGIGLDFKQFYVSANFDLGVKNIGSNELGIIYNRFGTLCVGLLW